MPAISKIRLTNVVYENGQKRYHDEVFLFDGLNGALVLENGGGKTVFIQTVVQAVIPHATVADRDIKDTLYLEESPAHIAIEWIINENPRRYIVTAVTLHKKQNGIDSLRYVYEYGENDAQSITEIPFVQKTAQGIRPSDRGEMADYYAYMEKSNSLNAKTFSKSIKSFTNYIENHYQIIHSEWENIIKINGGEGDVEKFFDKCSKTDDLVNRLLIPSIENAMDGFKEHGFAETFENRRAEFKKYKALKETIEQSKQLNQELKIYVDYFRKVDEKEQTYNEVRQHAKGYMHLLAEEMNEITGQLTSLEEQWQRYNQDMEDWERKSASLDIIKQRRKWKEYADKEQLLHAQLLELQDRIEKNRQLYFSLMYAQHRETSNLEKAQLTLVEQQLAEIEKTKDVADLQSQLNVLSGNIQYAFSVQKQQLDEQIYNLSYEQQLVGEKKTLLEKQQDTNDAEIEKELQQRTKSQTALDYTHNQMKDIKSRLVARDEESIEQLLEDWVLESEKLDLENVNLSGRLKKIKELQNEYNQQVLEIEKDHSAEELTKARIEQQLEHITKQEKVLLAQMATLRGNWSHIQSIYEREQSFVEQITSQIERLEKEKEVKLIQERRTKRFIDDYEQQESFFADPLIERKITDWAQNFYVTSGIEFIQQHESELKGNNYPFWASTLITNEKDKNALIDKVKSIQHELTLPIYILSLDEARQVGNDFLPQNAVIVPTGWTDYQQQSVFLEYKREIQEIAIQRENERKGTEKDLRSWQQVYHSLKEFLEKYPFSLFKETEEQLFTINQRIENYKYEKRKIASELEKLKMEYEAKQSTFATNTSKYQDLVNNRIPQANQYIQLSRNIPILDNEVKQCESKIQLLKEVKNNILEELQKLIGQMDEYNQRIIQLQNQKKYQIEENALYKQTESVPPTENSENLEVLKHHFKTIEDQIKQIQTSRGELLERLKNCLEKIEAAKVAMNEQLEEWPNLDTKYAFPIDGLQQISSLRKIYLTLIREQKELNDTHNAAQVAVNTEQRILDQLQAHFVERFKELWEFEGDLDVALVQLKQQKQTLQKEARFIKDREKQLIEQQELCKSVEKLFDQYSRVHRLLDPMLIPLPLTETEQSDYLYNKLALTNKLMNQLEQAQQQYNKALNVLADAKDQFIGFAEKNVIDPTLRKTTIDGVKMKQTFAEILEHDQHMSERIENVIQLAENTMRDHDKELQQFITYIHMHIRKLRDDLHELQKKTKVKVENETKYIYKIDVPDWDDEIAKERIQEYIDWILSKLETVHYIDETGKEDSAKVQRFLHDSFKTVPILRVVMGNQSIKVKCRKVKSATHISNTFYTWEESNRWSGGEKWSKNMALFLGLLNFIAEKSQKLAKSMKRNRTVILDNPFGKASSDHVLSPVFFIADQLGFQLITLTAHAEGKFLSDYFPIVYSCRLKFLEGQSKQVLTKEKILQKAYLRDHAPESLERLGERQQLVLFE
ncbi:coiled-coil domain-containing protein [Ureibacillus manganicus]|uniref:hypothetical protein n=1 Tax=Ureibacillus manganicus TaxID=1266064 RepID=UPI00068A2015|nr:hypothetical protein [Ureibacillus manganicus]